MDTLKILLVTMMAATAFGCFSRNNEADEAKPCDQTTVNVQEEKTWIFAVGGNRRPGNYFNESGHLTGSNVDIVKRMCAVAKKKCRVVVIEYNECGITDREISYPGRGLMAGWFDACVSYVKSVDKLNTYDYTTGYKQTVTTYSVAPGNPSGFNPDVDDFSSVTVVVFSGLASNGQCLSRLGKSGFNIIYVNSLPDAKNLVLNNTAQVLISPRTRIPGLETLPARIRCDVDGIGVLSKKGSELNAWWDKAFRTWVQTGGYAQFCREVVVEFPGIGAPWQCMQDYLDGSRLPPLPPTAGRVGKKVWLFATSGRRNPFSMFDATGVLTGFHVDLVHAVCRDAGLECEVVLTQFTECSFTDPDPALAINYAGRGLMDGWFDACVGYSDTLDRDGSADFTDAFLKTEASFAVPTGNPKGFDPKSDDYSAFTLTHLTGGYTNPQCLTRLKKKFGKIIVVANLPEAKALLANGTADVIFSPRARIPDLDVLADKIQCVRTGSAMMTKVGSPLVEVWNKAFRAFSAKGLYHKLCRDSQIKYNNYPFKCFDEYVALPTRAPYADIVIG